MRNFIRGQGSAVQDSAKQGWSKIKTEEVKWKDF